MEHERCATLAHVSMVIKIPLMYMPSWGTSLSAQREESHTSSAGSHWARPEWLLTLSSLLPCSGHKAKSPH